MIRVPEELREQRLKDVDPGVYGAVVVRWPTDSWGELRDPKYSTPSYDMCRVVVTGTYQNLLVCHTDTDVGPRDTPAGVLETPDHNNFLDRGITAGETFYLHWVCCTWTHWQDYVAQIRKGWDDRDARRLQDNAAVTRGRLTDFGLHPRDGYPTVEVDAPALQTFLDSWESLSELKVRLAEVEQELADVKRVAA